MDEEGNIIERRVYICEVCLREPAELLAEFDDGAEFEMGRECINDLYGQVEVYRLNVALRRLPTLVQPPF